MSYSDPGRNDNFRSAPVERLKRWREEHTLGKHDKEASNRYFHVTAALEPFSSFLATNLGTSYNLSIAGSSSGLAQLLLTYC